VFDLRGRPKPQPEAATRKPQPGSRNPEAAAPKPQPGSRSTGAAAPNESAIDGAAYVGDYRLRAQHSSEFRNAQVPAAAHRSRQSPAYRARHPYAPARCAAVAAADARIRPRWTREFDRAGSAACGSCLASAEGPVGDLRRGRGTLLSDSSASPSLAFAHARHRTWSATRSNDKARCRLADIAGADERTLARLYRV
jgi:hypothetical protein